MFPSKCQKGYEAQIIRSCKVHSPNIEVMRSSNHPVMQRSAEYIPEIQANGSKCVCSSWTYSRDSCRRTYAAKVDTDIFNNMLLINIIFHNLRIESSNPARITSRFFFWQGRYMHMPVNTAVRAVVRSPDKAAPLGVLCLRAGAFTFTFVRKYDHATKVDTDIFKNMLLMNYRHCKRVYGQHLPVGIGVGPAVGIGVGTSVGVGEGDAVGIGVTGAVYR